MYKHFSLASLACLSVLLLQDQARANTVYNVDQSVGIGSVTGQIVTDGTIGVLAASDIVSWNLLLYDGSSTFDLLASNSQFGESGSDLSATATELLFNFSGAGWAMFQAPTLFSGHDLWCTQGTIECTSSTGTGEVLNVSVGNQFTGLSGTLVIANGGVSSVPEPNPGLILGVALLLLGLRLKRKPTGT